jgi:hypothetical protein
LEVLMAVFMGSTFFWLVLLVRRESDVSEEHFASFFMVEE